MPTSRGNVLRNYRKPKPAARSRAKRAMDYMFGYCCLLDITIRDKEERVMRKSFDTFTPVGPWIATAEEILDASDIRMRLCVNGVEKQAATTRGLIVDIPMRWAGTRGMSARAGADGG